MAKSARVRHWDIPSVAVKIARAGETIYLGTGIVSLRGDRIASCLVDRSADGQYRMESRL
jgi:hypothetical protein